MLNLGPDVNVTWFDDATTVRVGERAEEIIVEWPDFVRLTVNKITYETKVDAIADLDAPTLRRLEHGLARAIPGYLRGGVVFHAAAVSCEGRGALLLGEAGAGKSTTAALLCQRGAALLADDCALGTVMTDGTFVVEPLEDVHWLDAKAREHLHATTDDTREKEAVAPTRVASKPARIALIVVLDVHTDSDTTVMVERCHGVHAARHILDAALRMPLGPSRSVADLERFAAVAKSAAVYRVLRPTSFTSTLLEAFVSTLFRLLEQTP